MKVKCIDNTNAEVSLTIGKVYIGVESSDGKQYLVNADDEIIYFNKSRFEAVE